MIVKMKKQKGVTLIALVVTIVVLLILGGTTIAILTRATTAWEIENDSPENPTLADATPPDVVLRGGMYDYDPYSAGYRYDVGSGILSSCNGLRSTLFLK